jgi:cyclophilin family peptidyl-prolyl cis-trans isomerase
MKNIILSISFAIALFVNGCSSTKTTNINTNKIDPNAPIVTHKAIMETSMGKIEIELYGIDAPKTVANFVGLADKNFYSGILFHRVVTGFVIQAGDPKSKDPAMKQYWGQGGESIYGKEFADELNSNTPSYKQGYVPGSLAMANRGPNTNTSQFFICLDNAEGLQKNYTMFGKVTSGMDVVKKIEGSESTQPKVYVEIKSLKATSVN